MAHTPGGVLVARPDEIVQLARSNGVRVELFTGLDPVRTVVEASDALDRGLDEVGNTVLVTVRDDPILVIVPGDRQVNGHLVGARYNAGPLDVSLATQGEIRETTGYDRGMIPPFGLEKEIDILVDERLLDHETILVPTGSPRALLEVATEDLAKLPNAHVGEFSAPPPDKG